MTTMATTLFLLCAVHVVVVSSGVFSTGDKCPRTVVPFTTEAEARAHVVCYCRGYEKLMMSTNPSMDDFDFLLADHTSDTTEYDYDGMENFNYRKYRKMYVKFRRFTQYFEQAHCKMTAWTHNSYSVKQIFVLTLNVSIFNVSMTMTPISSARSAYLKFHPNGKMAVIRQRSLDGRVGRIAKYIKESVDAEEVGTPVTFLDEFWRFARFVATDPKLGAAIAVLVFLIVFSALVAVYMVRKCIRCCFNRTAHKHVYAGVKSPDISSTETETETETETD